MAGFQPAECPKDCIYRGAGKPPGCNYLAMTDELRGCDPGAGCIRYKSRRNSQAKKTPAWSIPAQRIRQNRAAELPDPLPQEQPLTRRPRTWDVGEGFRMWQEGVSYTQIAQQMGVKRCTVAERANRCWKNGKP